MCPICGWSNVCQVQSPCNFRGPYLRGKSNEHAAMAVAFCGKLLHVLSETPSYEQHGNKNHKLGQVQSKEGSADLYLVTFE